MSEPQWLSEEERELWMKLVRLSMLMPSAVEAQLKREAGMNQFEYLVLAMLSEVPDMTRLMSDLAFQTNASLSRLSHVVTRLEQQGWVRRSACPTDGRATNVILTDVGYEKLKDTAPGHVTAVRNIIFDPLTPELVSTLNRSLQPILDSVEKNR
ncbi:MarR family winged helix-turn-helix transcriptional regulator [Leucobacter sp. M11]|uniref:MarR family winged helix-turn-helix transcriptional regulator n=1 Tax=Leucobacter sp. M11 TaxID=2993565 RepID=UPI002D7FE0E7|nr:MarR family transcriptional regulator [Leucobacter sp. M11]MEB4615835.1 MarR family transcriptional regulator [Leucobacter sp. M11]